jgi:hypothetical protein
MRQRFNEACRLLLHKFEMGDIFERLGLGPRPADVNTVSFALYAHDQTISAC